MSYRPAVSYAIDIFKEYFLNRDDVVAVQSNERIFPVFTNKNLDQILTSHLTGEFASAFEFKTDVVVPVAGPFKVGSYSPDKNNKTKWACIDFDGKGHAYALKNSQQAVKTTKTILKDNGLESYIERSSGGAGYHLWVFFTEPFNAVTIRAILLNLIPKNFPLEDSNVVADPVLGRGIELFPKASELIGDNSVGTMVWLPFFNRAQPGGGLFYNDLFEPILLTEFKRNSEAEIKKVFDELGGEAKLIPKQSTKIEIDKYNEYTVWRQKVLAALNLEQVYGQWLVGSSSGIGWLRCRDPWAPSNNGKIDPTPSAGVANGEGDAERGSFHSFISGNTISVFDFIRKIGLVEDNFTAACRYLSNLTGVDLPVNKNNRQVNNNNSSDGNGVSGSGSGNERQLPNIQINNRQFRDVLQDAWRAIHLENGQNPYIFQRANLVVSISKPDLSGLPSINILEQSSIYGLLGRIANWLRIVDGGRINADPPEKIARDIVHCDHVLKDRLPLLDFVTNIPVFNKFGSLVLNSGYDKASGIWFAPSEDISATPSINLNPSWSEVEQARALILDDLFCDFPFNTDADKANCLAALFLPFIRNLISGPTPLHVVEAPTAGTGKGKLCNLISILVNGAACESRSIPSNEDEIRKAITAELVKGKAIILLDNASEKKKLDSATLASVLTATSWTDRILGETKMVSLPNQCLWLLTANNPAYSMEISRRCIKIRLDSKTDRPWQRKQFKHKFIEDYTKKNRAKLVHAILTLIQYWISKGSPLGDNLLGSFERWSVVLGGILKTIGLSGFLENLEEMYEASDEESRVWRVFVINWRKKFQSEAVKAMDLLKLCEENGFMEETIGEGTSKTKLNKLVTALRIARDRTISGWKIEILKEGLFRLKGEDDNEVVKKGDKKTETIFGDD